MIDTFSLIIGGRIDIDDILDDKYRGVHEVTKGVIRYYNLLHFQEQPILITKDDIKLAPISVVIREPSCLKMPINHQIFAFRSSGLVQHWEKKYIKTIKEIEDNEPKKLNIDQFIGLIKICAVLHALSFLIFITELLTLKYRKMKKIIDFFTFK